MAAVVTALDTLDTELTADVVAFCPHPAWRHLMACGCYELIKGESPRRMGRLQLLDVTGQKMKEAHRIDGPGILDCAWLVKGDEPPLLAAATADCTAQLYRLESDGTLSDVGALACPDAGDACMSLDWCSADHGPARLALSSTAGRLDVLDAAPAGMRCVHSWGAHELEGWSVAFDRAEPSTLYSGGDDAILKRWDLRTASADGRLRGDDAQPRSTARAYAASAHTRSSRTSWRRAATTRRRGCGTRATAPADVRARLRRRRVAPRGTPRMRASRSPPACTPSFKVLRLGQPRERRGAGRLARGGRPQARDRRVRQGRWHRRRRRGARYGATGHTRARMPTRRSPARAPSTITRCSCGVLQKLKVE